MKILLLDEPEYMSMHNSILDKYELALLIFPDGSGVILRHVFDQTKTSQHLNSEDLVTFIRSFLFQHTA